MKPAHTLTTLFLVLIAVAHALRLVFHWEIVINGATIPMWPSILAVIVFLGLAIALRRETRQTAP